MVPKWLHLDTMASLTLKNLPDELIKELRAAAEDDRRSLNQEAIHLLMLALRARASPPPTTATTDAQAQVAAWRKLAGKWASDVDRATEARALIKRRSRGRKVNL
jgi:plasmid stability protein